MAKEILLRFGLGMFGCGVLGGLLYAWTTPGQEWVVYTIFPMMATPYILAVAAILTAIFG